MLSSCSGTSVCGLPANGGPVMFARVAFCMLVTLASVPRSMCPRS